MVITRLSGGLGNQMFQYAAGLQIAMQFKVPLKLDLSWYETQSKRSYRLNCFNHQAEIANQKEIEEVKRSAEQRSKAFLKWRYRKAAIIKEQSFSYLPDIFKEAEPNTLLMGYWQSERYFDNIKETLRNHFTPKNQYKRQVENTAEEVKAYKHAVSIHIRRGDYVHEPSTNAYHGVCSLDYYRKAIQKLATEYENIELFLFSDDISWAKNNLKTVSNVHYITDFQDKHPVCDMYVMSFCRHHIIANSSYSWWGAWLQEAPDSTVIAPKNWFADNTVDTSTLIPERWPKI